MDLGSPKYFKLEKCLSSIGRDYHDVDSNARTESWYLQCFKMFEGDLEMINLDRYGHKDICLERKR